MYSFKIKDNSIALETATTRALLSLAALACLAFSHNYPILVHISAAAILLLAAIFIKRLLYKYGINKMILLALAAVLLATITGSIVFAIILFIMGFSVSFIYKQPQVIVNNDGIRIEKILMVNQHKWEELNFVVLKDGLLTLDFVNNKILQLTIDAPADKANEAVFNQYCSRFLKS